MKRLPFLVILLAIATTFASEKVAIVAVDESRSQAAFLLESEIVLLKKWPLRLYVFGMEGLEGCSLAYSDVIDLKKVRFRSADGGTVEAICGKTRITGRLMPDLVVTSGIEGATAAGWTATRDGRTMTLSYGEPGKATWSVSVPTAQSP